MLNILLTGAGFTANFGTPLAKDIYNILFNAPEVQNNSKIRDLFLLEKNISHSDYENIYDEILNDSTISKSEKDSFSTFIWETFLTHVDSVDKTPQWKDMLGYKKQQNLFERFMVKFCNSQKSIFFTLNQDLFIERQLAGIFLEYSSEKTHLKSVLETNKMPKDNPTVLESIIQIKFIV